LPSVSRAGRASCSIPGWFFRISTVITLLGGTMFLMWLGEQITARGIGNGISLIIFAGIVAASADRTCRHAGTRPHRRASCRPRSLQPSSSWSRSPSSLIVFVERAQRRLLIQYPKRQVGNRMFQGDTSHLPLKLNTSGVIPAIFASSLLLLPATLAGFATIRRTAGLGDHDRRRPRPRPAASTWCSTAC
jgi:preprotein translocase subunit SecY